MLNLANVLIKQRTARGNNSSTNNNNDDSRRRNTKEKEQLRDTMERDKYTLVQSITRSKRTDETHCSLDDRLRRENVK